MLDAKEFGERLFQLLMKRAAIRQNLAVPYFFQIGNEFVQRRQVRLSDVDRLVAAAVQRIYWIAAHGYLACAIDLHSIDAQNAGCASALLRRPSILFSGSAASFPAASRRPQRTGSHICRHYARCTMALQPPILPEPERPEHIPDGERPC